MQKCRDGGIIWGSPIYTLLKKISLPMYNIYIYYLYLYLRAHKSKGIISRYTGICQKKKEIWC